MLTFDKLIQHGTDAGFFFAEGGSSKCLQEILLGFSALVAGFEAGQSALKDHPVDPLPLD